MATVLYRPLAEEDLRQIVRFIAKDDRGSAVYFVMRLEVACQRCADFPKAGRARDEIMTGLRSFPFRNYVIFYMPREWGIEVLHILNKAQDFKAKF